MIQVWQLQDAKNKLSEVVDKALRGDPQVITRHGTQVAVVLSIEEYRKLTAARPRLIDVFRNSPLVGEDIDLSRDKSPLPKPLEL